MSATTTWRRLIATLTSLLLAASFLLGVSTPAAAQTPYSRISGEGSSWAANFVDAARLAVRTAGITVDFNPNGSTAGRRNFLNGTVDFAVSDVPFQFAPEDGSPAENPVPGSYGYVPFTGGGTAFMYNLVIDGRRVTNLRLSGENAAKIFTRVITRWDDPALVADNPQISLPDRAIVPVVRSDGAATSQLVTSWMIERHPAVWNDYCVASGRAPACGPTSFFPTVPGMISQTGDLGVAGYVSQAFAEGSIGYVNYSYALGVQFPVAKVLNAAGYYTAPTPDNVAVSLTSAVVDTDASNPATYLTADLSGVFTGTDPRNYELSSYSYLIVPKVIGGQFNESKGRTLAAFGDYSLCEGQQVVAALGYSPLPVNLVAAGLDQLRLIPGADVAGIDVSSCANPTFSPTGRISSCRTLRFRRRATASGRGSAQQPRIALRRR
jgi:phosphate transport system substrate-binding protein